jgi:hypothetical protein
MDVSPVSARIRILPSTGLTTDSKPGSYSQSMRGAIGAAVGSINSSWASVYTSTQSSLQCSHMSGLRVAMYLKGPFVQC